MDIHVEIAAEKLFDLGPIPVTNSMLTMFIVMGAILLAGSLIARRAQVVPGKAQGAFELIVEFLLGLVEGTGGKRAGRRIFPLVGGIFIFIIFANYSGLLPGVGTIGYYHTVEHEDDHGGGATEGEEHNEESPGTDEEAPGPEDEVEIPEAGAVGREVAATDGAALALAQGSEEDTEGEEGAGGETTAAAGEEEHGEKVLVPFFRSPNADLNMTLAMALLTFTVVQIAGIQAHGFVGRLKHMADPPFLFPIEVISELSRIISLSARLFGNVFAGEVLLAVMYAMAAAIRIAVVPVVFPVVFLGLELLFGAIQALVFALLTLIYITLATAGGHGEHERETHTEGAHGAATVPAGAHD